MRYVCLVYIDAALAAASSETEWQQIRRDCLAFNEELKQSGHYVAASELREPATARTLRRRDGRLAITDGPFAETKEHLGGFLLIEASDLEEAAAIGARCPITRVGAIEVRATDGFG